MYKTIFISFTAFAMHRVERDANYLTFETAAKVNL